VSLPSKLGRLSRVSLTSLVVVAALAVALAIVLTRGQQTTGPEGAPAPSVTAGPGAGGAASAARATGTAVTLAEVVDGDTIWVRMPDGSREKVRYIGIDAPEVAHEDSSAEYLGDEATVHNTQLLKSGPVRLETDVEERDEYGRLLAYVWSGEVFINERMVLDGYAWAHNYRPNLARQDQLWAAHDRARAAGVGVWAVTDD
jgi:micrococcal nuclease